MKKLMLYSILSILFFNTYPQDTTCTYFNGKYVYEFDYYMDTVIHRVKQETKFYDIKIKLGNVLCLDLSDDKKRIRKVITTFSDGETNTRILKSPKVYYTIKDVVKISVGRPKIFKNGAVEKRIVIE